MLKLWMMASSVSLSNYMHIMHVYYLISYAQTCFIHLCLLLRLMLIFCWTAVNCFYSGNFEVWESTSLSVNSNFQATFSCWAYLGKPITVDTKENSPLWQVSKQWSKMNDTINWYFIASLSFFLSFSVGSSEFTQNPIQSW